MRTAPQGTGVIAGGPMRAVFEMLGLQDVVAKSIGSQNPYNMIRATMNGLQKESSPRMVAQPSRQTAPNADRPRLEQNAPHTGIGRYPIRARHDQQDPAYGSDHRRKRLTTAGVFRAVAQLKPCQETGGVFCLWRDKRSRLARSFALDPLRSGHYTHGWPAYASGVTSGKGEAT